MRGTKTKITISIIIILVIGVIFLNNSFTLDDKGLEQTVKNILEKPIPLSSESSLVGTTKIVKNIEFTVLSVTYSKSNNPSYSEIMEIKIRAKNLDAKNNLFSKDLFYLLDNHSVRYTLIHQYENLKPSIPQNILLKFEIPKDDSLDFSLYLSVHSPQVTTDSINIGKV